MEVTVAYDLRAHVPASREREHSILASLHPRDAAALRASGERVALAPGTVLAAIGEPLHTVWIPDRAIVSLAERHSEGRYADVGLIGDEGLIGWQFLLGAATMPLRCTVELGGGHGLAIPVVTLTRLCAALPEVRELLLTFAAGFTAQVGRTFASALFSRPDARLARWLLLFHDRQEGDDLFITHQRLAELLGVRRATITDALHLLEGARLLRCTRGRVTVRDRDGLIALAGAAYGGTGAGGPFLAAPPVAS